MLRLRCVARCVSVVALLAAISAGCARQHRLLPTEPEHSCALEPASLGFGAVVVGQSADRTVTLTNTGTDSMAGALSESCGDFAVVGNASYRLAPGAAAAFTLRFSPGGAGDRACAVAIGDCGTVPLSGTGRLPSASCQVVPTTLDFGTVAVGQSAERSFVITNTGGGSLSGTATESCAEFQLAGSGAFSLGAGQSDTYTVRFAPASGGVKSCTIATGVGCSSVSASGTGQAPNPPACQVSDTTLSFGTVAVGQSAEQSFTIRNTGGGRLSGAVTESCLEYAIAGPASYDLGAGESAAITVRFAPLTPGVKACTIVTGAGCADVGASGTGQGVTPSCQLSTTMLEFGTVRIGKTADRELTVSNAGGGTLSGTLTESCEVFSILGTPTYSLGPLQSATFTIRFTPTQAARVQCSLDAGAGCGTVALQGKGKY